jgi:DNA repair exonuclease SbcCD ATPase subunit
MEKLTAQKRISVVRQYLSGLSYDEIATKTRVSKGSVANVVTDLKAGEIPEAADIVEQIELLRELSIDLKASALTPGQCAVGLTVFKRINECGLDPADIERWPLILRSAGNEDQLPDFIRLVYDIQEVMKKTGMNLEELRVDVQELEKKAIELEPIAKQCEDTKKQVAELTAQRNNITDLVAGLEQKYKFLNPRVNDLEKREQSLLQRTSSLEERAEKAETTFNNVGRAKQELNETGFSLAGLTEFNQRVKSIAQRHQIKPTVLRHRLLNELENLDAGLGLETLVESQQIELNNQTQALEMAKRKLETLKATINNLEQEKASLETSIKNTREKVCTELAQIAPAASSAINRLVDELRRGHEEALAQVRQLRKETLEAGKEIGRLQGVIQTNEWLRDLQALVKNGGELESKRMRVITLLVLRGAAVWMQQNKTNQLKISTLLYYTDYLIKELEEWKT